MNTEVINQLKEVMIPIANKIGEGAEFGWEIVLRQQYVTAYLGLFCVTIGIVLGIIVFKFVKYAIKKYQEDTYSMYDFWAGLVGVLGGIIIIVLVISGFYDAITHFINPQYYAIEFFINLIK